MEKVSPGLRLSLRETWSGTKSNTEEMLKLPHRGRAVGVVDGSHADFGGWQEVCRNVVDEHADVGREAELLGRHEVDLRVRLADADLAGDDHRVVALVQPVARIGVDGLCSPRVAEDPHPNARRPRPCCRVDDPLIRSQPCQHAGDQPAWINAKQSAQLPLEGCLADLPTLDPVVQRPSMRIGGHQLAEPAARNAKPLEVVLDRGEEVGRDDAAEVQQQALIAPVRGAHGSPDGECELLEGYQELLSERLYCRGITPRRQALIQIPDAIDAYRVAKVDRQIQRLAGPPAPFLDLAEVDQGSRQIRQRRTPVLRSAGSKASRANTERSQPVIDAFVALAHAIITLRRLIRRACTHYRWDHRPRRRP